MVLGGGLRLGLRGRFPVQTGASRELPVRRGRAARRGDGAVAHRQAGRGDTELRRGSRDEDIARFGAREAQRGAALLHGKAAGGLPFVRRTRGVAADDLDALKIHVELVGRDLRQRGADPLPELDLSGEDRHRAVRIDPEPGVEHAIRVETCRQRRRPALRERDARSEGESDDERPARLDEVTARDVGHDAHDRISLAARCTARTIRLCEAHRQRCPFSACLISSSLGPGFRSSSAFADITIPFPQ